MSWHVARGGGPSPSRRVTATPLVRLLAGAVILVGCVLGQLVLPAPVWAHNVLVSSTPADGATVRTAPRQVVLRFNEPVGARFGVVVVTGPDGKAVQRGDLQVSGTTATQPLGPLAAPGTYTVAWRVVSADGHPVSGTLRFELTAGGGGQRPSTTTPAPGTASADTPTATVAPPGAQEAGTGTARTPWALVAGAAAFVLLAAVALTVAFLRGRSRDPERSGGPDPR